MVFVVRSQFRIQVKAGYVVFHRNVLIRNQQFVVGLGFDGLVEPGLASHEQLVVKEVGLHAVTEQRTVVKVSLAARVLPDPSQPIIHRSLWVVVAQAAHRQCVILTTECAKERRFTARVHFEVDLHPADSFLVA